MDLIDVREKIPLRLYESILNRGINKFLPSQEKAINSGLLDTDKNFLICTPTASGKTLIAELTALTSIYNNIGKAIYIAPLKALATEKYNEFVKRYPDIKIILSIGDKDAHNDFLDKYDLIITTSEKFDSEIRHNASWLKDVKTVIIDEIHLLNEPSRGPTLEIVITILKNLIKGIRIIGLSATIGNPEKLAEWLSAELIIDQWRPVELKKGILLDNEVEFFK